MFGKNDEVGDIKPVIDPTERRYVYEQALMCIDREENLIHYRMSWGLQWNVGAFAALFAVHGLTMSEYAKAISDLVVAGFGIFVCLIGFSAVNAAHRQSWLLC